MKHDNFFILTFYLFILIILNFAQFNKKIKYFNNTDKQNANEKAQVDANIGHHIIQRHQVVSV